MAPRIVLAGSSGLIGSALSAYLTARGDEVVRLVRRPARTAGELSWDPAAGRLDAGALQGAAAVVNLAGAGVGDKRWSEDYKALIRSSRVDTTRTLALAVAASGEPIRFVNASAVGYYGSDRGDDILTEESAPGQGFLAGLVRDWEAATAPAAASGAPVALARTGLVMDATGGAFARLVLLTKLGLGGPIGSGKQYWPWISLHDEVRALAWLVDHPEVTGAVNVVGPDPLRQAAIAAAIAARLHRPHVVPAPAAALKLVLGEFADDVLGSQRVIPARLVASGFRHDHPSIEDAVAAML